MHVVNAASMEGNWSRMHTSTDKVKCVHFGSVVIVAASAKRHLPTTNEASLDTRRILRDQ